MLALSACEFLGTDPKRFAGYDVAADLIAQANERAEAMPDMRSTVVKDYSQLQRQASFGSPDLVM
jgi:hypothetical protein